jgi:hypothetical protein
MHGRTTWPLRPSLTQWTRDLTARPLHGGNLFPNAFVTPRKLLPMSRAALGMPAYPILDASPKVSCCQGLAGLFLGSRMNGSAHHRNFCALSVDREGARSLGAGALPVRDLFALSSAPTAPTASMWPQWMMGAL